jgi:hypothetical protein
MTSIKIVLLSIYYTPIGPYFYCAIIIIIIIIIVTCLRP